MNATTAPHVGRHRFADAARWLVGIVLLLAGLWLLGGGVALAMWGGSWYYVAAGVALVAAGALLATGRESGVWLYAIGFVATLAWAFYEVGADGWQLMPRLAAPAVLMGVVLALLPSCRRWADRELLTVADSGADTVVAAKPSARGALTTSAVLALIAAFAGGWSATAYGRHIDELVQQMKQETAAQGLPSAKPADAMVAAGNAGFAASDAAGAPAASAAPAAMQPPHDASNWTAYGGADDADRFTPSAQITPANAGRLQVAWEFHTGDLAPKDQPAIKYAFQDTPQKIGDSLYVCSPSQILIALDPTTGSEKWRFDPNVDRQAMANVYHATCRGVAYYESAPSTVNAAECAKRILFGTTDGRLLAIDTATGRPCSGFGTAGSVDLNLGMDNDVPGFVSMNSAPIVVHDVVITGHQVRDNQRDDAPSGVVRGYDAVTGALRWAWDMGRPDQAGLPPAGEHYTKGTPNVWTNMSADEALGLVYLPTGNSADDYFGGNRKPYEERYSSSIVALDADTGKVRWSYQTVHHDIWDYDLGSQASLVDFPDPNATTANHTTPALIVPSKEGRIFVLDRRDGHPLLPVNEIPVPQGAAPGDFTAPTQPEPQGLPDIIGARLTDRDGWGLTPIDQLWCRIQFARSRYDGPYTPPTLGGTILYPGYNGGVDWGGVAIDTDRGILVVNNNRLANYNQLLTRQQAEQLGLKGLGEPGAAPNLNDNGDAEVGVPYADNGGPWMSPLDMPCLAPPWGFLGAIDLKTRKLLWRKPIGTGYDSGPLRIPSKLKITIGTPNNGGSVVTRGGVTFIAATLDRYLRAFDTQTGTLLWEGRLPAGGQAGPMSYEAGGRQYVVIAAGGHSFMQTKLGDSVIAFALPKP
jgi:quinoprotein glucose dehydrogenase